MPDDTTTRRSLGALRRAASWLFELRYRVPLTPLGLALGLLALWVHRTYGGEEMDFVLYAAALVALALLGLSVLAVLLTSVVLWLSLRRVDGGEDLVLESGKPAATGFDFPRLRALPLVQLRASWIDPPEVDAELAPLAAVEGLSGRRQPRRGRLQEVVHPHQRGERPRLLRRFVVSDIFGLARFGLRRPATTRVRILPGAARVSGQVVASFIGGEGLSHPSGPREGELLDMRRYAPGDPLRLVLWKAYGRTRQLLVRSPERAIAPSPSVMAYFVAGEHDEAVAATARHFLEAGLLGDDFTFGADGSAEAATDVEGALRAVVASVEARRQGGLGLSPFLDRADKQRRRSLLLFVPAAEGPWVRRLAALEGRLSGATLITSVDALVADGRRSLLGRLLFSGAKTSQPSNSPSAQLPALAAKLTSMGFDLRVLHRQSGELISMAALLANTGKRPRGPRREPPSNRRGAVDGAPRR